MGRRRSLADWVGLALFFLAGLIVAVGLWIAIGVHDEYGWDATVQVLIATLVVATALGLTSWKLLRPAIGDKIEPSAATATRRLDRKG